MNNQIEYLTNELQDY